VSIPAFGHIFKGSIRDVGVVKFYFGIVPVRPEGYGNDRFLFLIPKKPLLGDPGVLLKSNVYSFYITIEERESGSWFFFYFGCSACS